MPTIAVVLPDVARADVPPQVAVRVAALPSARAEAGQCIDARQVSSSSIRVAIGGPAARSLPVLR